MGSTVEVIFAVSPPNFTADPILGSPPPRRWLGVNISRVPECEPQRGQIRDLDMKTYQD